MITKNIVLSLLAGLAFTAAAATAGLSPVFASDYCTTQYGGTETCRPSDLLINKQVQNPINGNFVENLGSGDSTFSPGSEVLFQLTIKNVSGQTFDPVVVKDVLPSYLTFVSGPGTYDAPSRTLTFTLNNLIAGETRNIQIMAKVLPTTVSFVCVNNYAEARADIVGRFDSDTAQFCIQTNVLGTTTLPVAGYNDLLLLLPFAGVGLTGIALLKKKS
jgi:uncharacterized repeat protein (TIGR01451 family)